MNRRFVMALVGVALTLLLAVLMVAWTMGGTRPMRWIETPVSVTAPPVNGGHS